MVASVSLSLNSATSAPSSGATEVVLSLKLIVAMLGALHGTKPPATYGSGYTGSSSDFPPAFLSTIS